MLSAFDQPCSAFCSPSPPAPLRVWLGITNLARASGGPSVVVQHLSEHLAKAGVLVTILTRSLPDAECEAAPRDGRVRVIRISAQQGLKSSRKWSSGIRAAIAQGFRRNEIDIFHDFGLWMPGNHGAATIAATLGLPFISSPCGMLAPWALRHKAWKKKLAWQIYQRRDLLGARVLVATSRSEAKHISKLFSSKPVALIPNGVDLPQVRSWKSEVPPLSSARFASTSGKRTMLFLGRIHPVKGLLNLVEAWVRVRPHGWRCIIAGPDEAGHRREIQAALDKHGIAGDFIFAGMVDGQEKWRFLADSDLFVLPSFTENFGIAIAEALAVGVPVITTHGTPWEELISRRCGWWVEIGVEPLTAALREATALDDECRADMGHRGRQLVEEKYAWQKIGQDMRALYEWVRHGGTKPGVFFE